MRKICVLAMVLTPLILSCSSGNALNAVSNAKQGDPLLGTWVFIDNPTPKSLDYRLDFRADGTAVSSFAGQEPEILKYKRESAGDWLARLKDEPVHNNEFFQKLTKPGVEMISFADPATGEFFVEGGDLLALFPEEGVLHNPLSTTWCRPGNEEVARKLMGFTSIEEHIRARNRRIQDWKSEKDITGTCRNLWKLDLEGGPLEESLTAGDLDGSGKNVVLTSTVDELLVIDGSGKVLRRTPLFEPSSYLVLGSKDGRAILAGFDTWGDNLRGIDSAGNEVWNTEVGERGIDWVAPVPIDSKNVAFIIGYNGGGGIEFVGADGKSIWKAPVTANVWNVAGARLKRDLPGFAICVGQRGALAFDHTGKQVASYGTTTLGAVGAGDLNGDDVDEVLTLGTTLERGSVATVYSQEGQTLWSKPTGGIDLEFLTDPFIVGNFGGRRLVGVASSVAVRFFDEDGKHIGDYVNRDTILTVAKLPTEDGSDLLLVRTEKQLLCLDLAAL